ncbi:MAG TPA: putative zinc-binding peptidase [Noviherbaspirillum sp.]|uniref:zinc-binding metallopeptidase family protein n=1 Tax=Noviherbaspirillum sp. TaxID=1926288 RepID=UPI002D67C57B|nr:putative zinc-binding peptidase [Noviherbaspirillum sp.]HYD95340.1 putative zinc-binding peptidase [Noviherbaspirillum sp.]
MRTFHCDKCGQLVFFENVRCENCGSTLGYQPYLRAINAYEETQDDLFRSLNPVDAGRLYKKCVNYAREGVCNWMLEAGAPGELCASCQLTRTIPSLASDKNRLFWKRLETAKRRLLYTLWELQLQPAPKADDPDAGLAFEFLEDTPGHRVMTGHADGVITINIAEADPAQRERTREQMGEPYRTVLGHFRHESGHYYFDRLVAGSKWIAPFRDLFGDERQDYAACLQTHYDQGPPADWDRHFVSSYASMHPWEDWAETWAHYLHMVDTLDTAFACGMRLTPKKAGEPALEIEDRPLRTGDFDELLADWFSLTYALNSLNRSVGMPDPYPFTLSTPVIDKLRFIHDVVLAHRGLGPR